MTTGTEQVLDMIVKLEWMAMEYAVLWAGIVFAAASGRDHIRKNAGKRMRDIPHDGVCR